MHSNNVRLLSAADLKQLGTPALHLQAAREAFAAPFGAALPPPLHLPCAGGGFHAKAAWLDGTPPLAVLKLNANFPGNPARGLPTIQGLLLLCEAESGRPLALMDSATLTAARTAAASALAATVLARQDAARLVLIGCGAQALAQIDALAAVRPLRSLVLHDSTMPRAEALATTLRQRGAIEVRAVPAAELPEATRAADIIVTCTPSTAALLHEDMVSAGCFIAAVGADHPHKQEIAPALMARCRVVVDRLAQCLEMGDLHHAVAAGAMQASEVHAELAQVLAGERSGRTSDDMITLFDSTGLGLQDATAARALYQRAVELGVGPAWNRLGEGASLSSSL